MKKPAKSAKKSPAKAKAPAKKTAPAKKAAPAKKSPVKAKSAKGAPAKKAAPAKKNPVKAKTTKASPKKVEAKSKSQSGLQKKIQDKIAASKKAAADKAAKKEKEKLAKKLAAEKKTLQKKLEAQKKAEKIAKEKEKVQAKAAKIAAANAAKEAKLAEKEAAKAAKLAAKAPKKLTKKEEKELLKAKGKKGSFEDEELEEGERRPRFEDEEEDDDFADQAPRKVKMTFDEDIEEEIPVRKKKSTFDEDIKENLAEEILALSEDFSIDEVFSSIRSMELFKVESDECVVRGCDNPSTTSGYCRYHYIKLWKDVKKKELILSEGRLAKIIEDLVRKYPMKYIETIIQDLADDKAFNHVLKDLDIETDAEEMDGFDDDELLDDDQDIAFETKVVKPSFDD